MDKEQIYLLKKIKKYFSKFESRIFKPKFNSIFYFATYSNFIGSYLIKKIAKIRDKKFFSNLNLIFKDFFFSLNYMNSYLLFNNTPEKFDKLIITWAFSENFDNKGNLIDRYLNKNSGLEKNTLWFVIYMDPKIPKNIGENVILFCKQEKKIFNVFFFIWFFN